MIARARTIARAISREREREGEGRREMESMSGDCVVVYVPQQYILGLISSFIFFLSELLPSHTFDAFLN